ncbi:phage protein GemA/Gp16 family protein [Phascolarctobacterium faecium]|uniref:phage protein GemA/Gp16 family protein n=1 Tax=Phascolarctobacterium faecium TaxID=33025 RepID=UPI003521DDBA
MRKNKLPDHAPITTRQLAMLHVAKNKLGLTDEDYRSVLLLYGGVESSKQLDQEGMRRVLDRFQQLGFEPIQNKVIPMRTANTDGTMPPSEAQLRYMAALFKEVGMREESMRESFCRRLIRKRMPERKYEANVIIEGLKKMSARGYKVGDQT